MELIREEKNKKIYSEESNLYTMLNMGNYIGHNRRKWYDTAPEQWYLMFYDGKISDGKDCHIESLVDSQGNFTRFILEIGDIKRVLQLQSGYVYSDSITKQISDDGIFESYYALDGDIYNGERYKLSDYLFFDATFSGDSGKYEGDIPSLELLLNYLNVNEELRNQIIKKDRRL